MPTRSQKAASACGVIFGLLVLVYPFVSGMAQKSPDQKNGTAQEQEDALKIVRQNLVASVFFDALQAQESDWSLTKADYIGGGEVITQRGIGRDPDSLNLVLKKAESEAQIIIYEYSSEEAARLRPRAVISQGRIEGCKGEECGDEGQKIYGADGKSFALEFRKGRFWVSIYRTSEEMTKRFAGYAVNSIGAR